jgi:hypothetical protein
MVGAPHPLSLWNVSGSMNISLLSAAFDFRKKGLWILILSFQREGHVRLLSL